MKIVEPYAHLMSPSGGETLGFTSTDGLNLLKRIEWCARISHRSEETQTMDSWERFIKAVVLDHGDWSVVEHASVSVDMLVDRGITHEVVRHRLFSYTQESTRFVNYEKKMEPSFIVPPLETFNHPEELRHMSMNDVMIYRRNVWEEGIKNSEEGYKKLVKAGIAPQIARSLFVNGLASRIIITGNLRNWRHFFIMRTTKEAHPQMKQVTIPLLKEFQEKIPILFDDIKPEARQIDNMRLPR